MTNEKSARSSGLTLNARQELLLSKYFDKECGVIGRFLAERLMRNNTEARHYLDSLHKIRQECRANSSQRSAAIDLWSRIESRIDAEERAAMYLGKRVTAAEPESFFSRIHVSQALFGGVSGAAVTALALLLVVGQREQNNLPTIARGLPGSTSQVGAFTQVALEGNAGSQQRAKPAMFASHPSSMEVDWMRANGPLKFIQNPEGKSAIIWVRRRGADGSSNRRTKATPTAGAPLNQPSAETMLYPSH